jgi:hypothetical protein
MVVVDLGKGRQDKVECRGMAQEGQLERSVAFLPRSSGNRAINNPRLFGTVMQPPSLLNYYFRSIKHQQENCNEDGTERSAVHLVKTCSIILQDQWT